MGHGEERGNSSQHFGAGRGLVLRKPEESFEHEVVLTGFLNEISRVSEKEIGEIQSRA
jgi:hypothetical protein